MGKISYLGKKLFNYLTIVVLAFIVIEGNYANTIGAEKPASNQSRPAKLQDEKNQQSNENIISDKNVKMFLDQIEIYGQIAKPQTVFIIPGTDPRVDGLRIDRHFFSHIFRPVEKSTLRRVRIKQGKDKDHILW